jgi:hypothetical protein
MIFEAVVITQDADGSPRVAPLGYRCAGDALLLAPFAPSRTLDNLRRTLQATVNLTDDVTVFAGALTGRPIPPLLPAAQGIGWRLASALAHREVEVVAIEEDPVRPVFRTRTLHHETHAPFQGFNRAQGAVLEAAILVSRLERLPREQVERELAYLQTAVDKTAGPRELLAWGWLRERMAAFYQGMGHDDMRAP